MIQRFTLTLTLPHQAAKKRGFFNKINDKVNERGIQTVNIFLQVIPTLPHLCKKWVVLNTKNECDKNKE